MWRLLRDRRCAAWKLRRQAPLGPWIADFVCHAARLVVEVDGGQHADSARDAARDAWMAAQGYRTLRFWNTDVLGNPEGVLELVLTALEEAGAGGMSPGRSDPSP